MFNTVKNFIGRKREIWVIEWRTWITVCLCWLHRIIIFF